MHEVRENLNKKQGKDSRKNIFKIENQETLVQLANKEIKPKESKGSLAIASCFSELSE